MSVLVEGFLFDLGIFMGISRQCWEKVACLIKEYFMRRGRLRV